MCPGAGFALSEYSHVFSFAIQLVSSCLIISGVAQSDLRIRASSTGPTPVAYSENGPRELIFKLVLYVFVTQLGSNGRVWLEPALDQVVRGAEMVSDRDTAQPGSPHVLVVSISLGRS